MFICYSIPDEQLLKDSPPVDLKEANYQTINHFLFFNIWWHLSPGTITAFISPPPPYTLQHNSSMTVPSIPRRRPRKAHDRWASKRCEAVRMIEREGVSVCQQAGSINLCADTVQAAFLCKADRQGSLAQQCRFTKRKQYLSQPGWPIHQ